MPLITSQYNPRLPFTSGYISTIYCGTIRKVEGVVQHRERISLPDEDFLDLDWSYANANIRSNKLVILLHGLEGNAQRHYMLGSTKAANQAGWDVCAVNFRSCSGVTNKLYRSYHSGATEDLKAVIDHIQKHQKTYTSIVIKGYSLGGNLTLKYLGEERHIPKEIKGAMVVSVPVDLKDACNQLLHPKNFLFAQRFKKHLLEKLWIKHNHFPEQISVEEIKSIKTLKDFDDVYTGPAHGFKDAEDYYAQCSSKPFLTQIEIPTLLINAKNDSFLGDACYPIEEAKTNKAVYLEITKYGGHVGFWGARNVSYVESRLVDFLNKIRTRV